MRTADPIEMRFGLLAPVDSKNREVGVLTPAPGEGTIWGFRKKQFKTTNQRRTLLNKQ